LRPSPISSRDPLAIALERKMRGGRPGTTLGKTLAVGTGWRVVDIVCTCGPADRAFEERYWSVAISLVLSGAFVYRAAHGSSLMSPGSLLLGNVGHPYECSHEHGGGDRCLSFQFDPALFEEVARDTGTGCARFRVHRVPPIRGIATLTTRATSAIYGRDSFEEVALEMAGSVLRFVEGLNESDAAGNERDRARIAEVLHYLEFNYARHDSVKDLARMAGLSPYHFLRSFKAVTGITPHQWRSRARLREAARLLTNRASAVTDVALEVGFQDLANFIRSFRTEFGTSPGRYRANS